MRSLKQYNLYKKMFLQILFVLFLFVLNSTKVFALQDCIIITNGKLTNISIMDNKVINVYPLITLMNDKNTIIVSPLKVGNTKFSVLKNGKEKYVFYVDVQDNKTVVSSVDGFETFVIDEPPEDFYNQLDLPPKDINIRPELRG